MTDHRPDASPAHAAGTPPARDDAGEPLPLRFHIGLAALTLAAWGMLGLGLYALTRAWQAWRLIFLVEAIMPLLLGGALALSTTRAWIALAQRCRGRRD